MIHTKKITLLILALSYAQLTHPVTWTRAIKHKTNEIMFSIKEFFNNTFNKAKRSPGTTTSITANGLQLVAITGLIAAVVIQSARIKGKNNNLATNQTTFNTQRTDLEARLNAEIAQKNQFEAQARLLQERITQLVDDTQAHQEQLQALTKNLNDSVAARDRAEAVVIQMQEEKRAMIEQQASTATSKNKKDKKDKSPRKSQDKQPNTDTQNPDVVIHTTGDVEKLETDPATQAETEKVRFGFLSRLGKSPKK
jgi:chromosome segregation ATPase